MFVYSRKSSAPKLIEAQGRILRKITEVSKLDHV